MEFIDIVEWSSLIISKSLKNHPPISQKSGSIAASNSLACMYVLRGINIRLIWAFAWKAMLGYIAWSSFIYLLYAHLGCKFLAIPFLPVATIGTAVAFYVGFKNNSAYDRLWEGRRIWGSITNASRTFANWIINWSGRWVGKSVADMEAIRREIVLRHIAWANVLRLQLRKTSVWENHYATTITNKMIHTTTPEEQFEEDIRHLTEDLLGKDEFSTVKTKGNKATYLLFLQSQQLTALKHRGLLSDFEHSDLEKMVSELYNQQGAAERIKSFPFPRQYGFFSTVFVVLFNVLLPFALLGELAKFNENTLWLVIPFSTLISWIFFTMETIGDSSENPFENSINDVPMTAICRNIERDLREMLGETDLPAKVQAVNGVLF